MTPLASMLWLTGIAWAGLGAWALATRRGLGDLALGAQLALWGGVLALAGSSSDDAPAIAVLVASVAAPALLRPSEAGAGRWEALEEIDD